MTPVDTRFERFFDSLPTSNFRVFAAVVTSVIVTITWSVGTMFGNEPSIAFVAATYGFLAAWMGIEAANHYLRRKTYDPKLDTDENRRSREGTDER